MPNFHGRLCKRAFVISAAVNVLMIVTGVGGRSTFLTRFSDILAAPPGVIILRCCGPREHTGGAFLTSIAASIVISVLFYAVVAWAILELVYWVKRVHAAKMAR